MRYRSLLTALLMALSVHTVVLAATAAEHCRQGMKLYGQGKLDGAAKEFREALRLDPRSDEAHTGLGVVLYAQGKVSEASAQWRQAVRLNPRNASAQVNLGSALVDLNRAEEAISVLKRALGLSPQSVGAHYNMGRALVKLRRTAEATKEYEAALRLNADFAPGWLALGTLHANVTRKPTEAVRCFEKYLKLVPNPPQCTCWIKAYVEKHRKR